MSQHQLAVNSLAMSVRGALQRDQRKSWDYLPTCTGGAPHPKFRHTNLKQLIITKNSDWIVGFESILKNPLNKSNKLSFWWHSGTIVAMLVQLQDTVCGNPAALPPEIPSSASLPLLCSFSRPLNLNLVHNCYTEGATRSFIKIWFLDHLL